MGVFANMTAQLNLNIANFASNLNKASGMLNTFASTYNGALTGNVPGTKAKGAFKDPSRIVQGIIVSKIFYGAYQNITKATGAVFEFTKQLEQSHIAYKQFFGDVGLVKEFVNVLKDFSAVTPFSFKDADAAAKQLLAYGFEYKNLMFLMRGAMNAAVAMGDTSKIPQITAALGQINAKGRVTGRELRRLAEANIPVYDILIEKLGVTQEQLKNIAKEYIPAGKAINAIIDGINERYGDLLFEMENTISGLTERVKDNAIMIFSSLFAPVTKQYKAFLRTTANFLQELRNAIETGGIGGLFEKLIPVELHSMIRTFIANIMHLWEMLKINLASVGQIIKYLVVGIIQVFNMIAPVVIGVLQVFTGLTRAITSNEKAMRILTAIVLACAAAWAVWKVRLLGAFIIGKMVSLVNLLSKALAFLAMMIVKHPLILFLGLAAGLLVGLSVGFDKVGAAMSNFFKKLTSFEGIDPDKLLLPSQEERASDLEKFNERLSDTKDGMEDLEKATKKANKSLLSFDEVFKLNEETGDNGFEGFDPEDFVVPDFDVGVPEVPDFGGFSTDYVMGLWEALKNGISDALGNLWDFIKERLLGLGLGSLLGALLGGLLGGPLGALIGALAGGLIGLFWEEIMNYLGLEPPQQVAMGFMAALGAIIGGLLGGPKGAAIGAIIGAMASALSSMLWNKIAEAFGLDQHAANKASVAATIGSAIGAIFGGIFGGPVGAAIGAIIGNFAGGLLSLMWSILAQKLGKDELAADKANIGSGIGAGIGAIIGGILGGPAGALIGVALGALAGGIVGMFWDELVAFFSKPIGAGVGIGGAIGAVIGAVFGGPVGAAIGAAIGAALGALVGLIVEKWSDIVNWFKQIGQDISDFFTGIGTSIANFFSGIWDFLVRFSQIFVILGEGIAELGSILFNAFIDLGKILWDSLVDLGAIIAKFGKWIWDQLAAIFGPMVNAIGEFFTNIWNKVSEAVSNIWSTVSGFFSDIWTAFSNWISNVWASFTEWISNIWDHISTFFSNVWTSFSTWVSDIFGRLIEWLGQVLEPVLKFFADVWASFTEWVSNIWQKFTEWIGNIWTKLSEWLSNIWSKITEWFSNVWLKFTTWIGDIWTKLTSWFNDIWSKFTGWLNDIWTKITGWFNDIWISFTGWLNNIWSHISQWFGGLFGDLARWGSELLEKIGNWFSNLWDSITGWMSDIADAISDWWDDLWDDKDIDIDANVNTSGRGYGGHAKGGVFNREHVARFAEGNKAEAIIPLEEQSAMRPFVDAVADGLTSSLGPLIAAMQGGSSKQPLFVGTLIADERSLVELQRKLNVIQIQEDDRSGD